MDTFREITRSAKRGGKRSALQLRLGALLRQIESKGDGWVLEEDEDTVQVRTVPGQGGQSPPQSPPQRVETYSGVLGLPDKFSSMRKGQEQVVNKIVRAYAQGKQFVIAELPTGTGKTPIAMWVQALTGYKSLFTCTTKSLMDQYVNDFPDAALIKGRRNYPCGRLLSQWPDITAEDCPGQEGGPARGCVGGCPYNVAKASAEQAEHACTNVSYLLNETQYVGKFLDREFVILDEADTLEDVLLDQVSVTIRMADIQRLGLGRPERRTKFEDWHSWAGKALDILRSKVSEINAELAEGDEDDWTTAKVMLMRQKKVLDRMAGKLGFFLKNVNEHWVWEEAKEEYAGRESLKWTFKPVLVEDFGDLVWEIGDRFLLMSATVLDFHQFEKNIGLLGYKEQGLVEEIRTGSTFPVEKRPIRVLRRGIDLSYKNYDRGMERLPGAVGKILEWHSEEKGVIHSVTYRIAQALKAAFPDRVLLHNSSNRAEIIKLFKESEKPYVLVSPSVERGEDFPDDICRFIVVAKLPFPFLGDPRIAKRLHSMRDGQRWYALKTVQKIIQMVGRGMRHAEDGCTSYILDAAFERVYRENRRLFPDYWREAIIWIGDLEEGEFNRRKVGWQQG